MKVLILTIMLFLHMGKDLAIKYQEDPRLFTIIAWVLAEAIVVGIIYALGVLIGTS